MSAIPHALQLAESVNSEFFAPVGNNLITSREAEDLLLTSHLPSVHQHLMAYDGDNTAAQPTHQRPAGAAPLALLHRLRLRGNYCALAGFTSGGWRYRPAASARRASPESSSSGAHTPSGTVPRDFHHARGAQQDYCRYHPDTQHRYQPRHAHIWLAGCNLEIVFGS